MKKKLPSWAALLVVCLLAGGLVLGANRLTADRIEQARADAKDAPLLAVLPGAKSYEALEARESKYKVDAAWAGLDADGAAVGYVGRATVNGYGGPVEILAGVDGEGKITGVSVGGEDFAETPGLGERTREAAFTDQFAGKVPEVRLGEDVDGVSGATITSRAVIGGVNSIAKYFHEGELGLTQEQAETFDGQVMSATKQGFAGDVTANVGLAADGTVAYLTVDTPNETDGLGKLCSESAFTDQFIGKRGPFTFGEDGVEAISGATYTSNAALEAINEVVSGGGEPTAAALKPAVEEGEPNASAGNPDETEGEPKATTTTDASKYMRPRPASSASPEAKTAANEADYMKYMRPRPNVSQTVEAEPIKPASGDATKYMRPRPSTSQAAAAESVKPASGDATKYMRPRPSTSQAAEAEPIKPASGDAMKYMRPRPSTSQAAEAEPDKPASGDATKYMRPRP